MRYVIIAAACLAGIMHAAVVQSGNASVEFMPQGAYFYYGQSQIADLDVFYICDAKWKKLQPEKNDQFTATIDGAAAVQRPPKRSPLPSEIRYAVTADSLHADMTVTIPANSGAQYAVWDIFLSKSIFADAVVKRDGQADVKLSPSDWSPIDTGRITLVTPLGEWAISLTADDNVPWKLRSVCDRTWGPEERRTFTMLHQIENIPAEGMKVHLSVDMRFTPSAGYERIEKERGYAKVVDYLRPLLTRYDPRPVDGSPTAENAAALSRRLADITAERTENMLPPGSGIIIPEPRSYRKDPGVFIVPQNCGITGAHDAAFEVLTEDLSRAGITAKRASSAPIIIGVNGDASVEAALKRLGGVKETAKEGYTLIVTPKEILIAGADDAGVLYGAQTLRQLIRSGTKGAEIPAVRITDRPDLPFRGFYIEAAGKNSANPDMKRLIRNVYSYFKANTIVYQIKWSEFLWKSHPELAGKDALPMSDLAEICAYAKKYRLRFIPAVFTYGKVMDLLKVHPEIAEDPDYAKKGWPNGASCPNRPETYALVFDLLNEIVDITGCDAMHIAHDEIAGMVACPVCKAMDPADLFANDVNKTADFLAKRNVKTMIWGDFLLEKEYWDKLGVESCNSGNPHYGGHLVHPALFKLRKDVIITDWHYNYKGTNDAAYPTFNYFATNGFSVIGCPWLKDDNNYYTAREIAAIHQQGVLITDWGFLATRAPAANSLLGAMYSWNVSMPKPDELRWSPQAMLAYAILDKDRPSFRRGAAFSPVDLSAAANVTLAGDGWFGEGTRNDLSLLPTGDLRLLGVAYRIGDKAVVCGGERTQRPLESKPIAISKKAKSLVFLQGISVDAPSVYPAVFGSYRIRYADGTTVDVPIDSRNATHWISSKPRKNPWQKWAYEYTWDASLAWQGCTVSGSPVNLEAYEWVNPNPNNAIASVTLIAKNTPGMMAGLIALTAVN